MPQFLNRYFSLAENPTCSFREVQANEILMREQQNIELSIREDSRIGVAEQSATWTTLTEQQRA